MFYPFTFQEQQVLEKLTICFFTRNHCLYLQQNCVKAIFGNTTKAAPTSLESELTELNARNLSECQLYNTHQLLLPHTKHSNKHPILSNTPLVSLSKIQNLKFLLATKITITVTLKVDTIICHHRTPEEPYIGRMREIL